MSYGSLVPGKTSLEGLETKWSEFWAAAEVYRFRPPGVRNSVFSIDTPPPTVSGSLHVGHVFSYTHTDIIARFQRMLGKHVFYPMGWDDNGLPTERRVQNYYGVVCDTSLPYDPNLTAPMPIIERSARDKKTAMVSVSRRNFVELCERLTFEDEKIFEQLWRRLGLSVDWTMTYTTMSSRSQRVSQTAFLRLIRRGEAYQTDAPTMWDITFQTAVANAEVVDKETTDAYYRLAFEVDGTDVHIDTTRPELLPACVALVVHPNDERYQSLFGKQARSPLFGVLVPIIAHDLAEPDKGTGIAMVCTFGDVHDVQWWRELQLPTRAMIGRDGRLLPLDFMTMPCFDASRAQQIYEMLIGKTVHGARELIVEALRTEGALIGESRSTTRPVKFYEKGERPLEIVSSRQWFIKTIEHRDEMLARGGQLEWIPPRMKARYDDWVRGLNADWLISRQRFFGVPIPVWYRLDDEGRPDYQSPILPEESELPVDPSSVCPAGFKEDQRGAPGGFLGDMDVMDTWATSSLSPQLACGWLDNEELFSQTYPMDLRPQAHDIIRTWLFYTVVRSHLENDVLPWKVTALSGWILDPDRKKMSKSQGNVVTPGHLLDEFGADAVRYWAAGGRPGTDTTFDVLQMKIGRRLATKFLNASKFVLALPVPSDDARVLEPLDSALLGALATTVAETTAAYASFDYTSALAKAERFFWSFCDDYLELVKDRAYGLPGDVRGESARLTLRRTLDVITRLFAPVLPYATEEAWSWSHLESVHMAPWPTLEETLAGVSDHQPELLQETYAAIAAIRKSKSDASLSPRADVARLIVEGPHSLLERIRLVADDLMAAGHISEIRCRANDGVVLSFNLEFDLL